jgi:hypothetical protein
MQERCILHSECHWQQWDRFKRDTGGSAWNAANVFGIVLLHQVVTLDNVEDARSEPA